MSSNALTRAFAVLLAACLVVPLVAGAGVVAQESPGGDASTASTNQTTNSSSNYTLDELRQLGNQPSGAPTSTRPIGGAGALWIRHVPLALGVASDDAEARQYVEPTTTVKRDEVWLGSFRGWNSDKETYKIHLVYWRVGEENYTTADGSVATRKVPVDVREQTVDATLAGGDYDEVRIPLKKAYDDPVYVTMWVENAGDPSELRWTFRHVSSAATAGVPVSNRGDAIGWALAWIFLPMLGTALGFVAIDRRVLRKAGAGPQVSIVEYGFAVLALAFVGGFVVFSSTMELLATAPWAIGVAGGGLVGVIVVEMFGDRTKRALFLQLTPGEGRVGTDGSGTWRLKTKTLSLVDLPGGEKGIIRRGFLPFLARAWPGYRAVPVLEYDGDPLTRWEGDDLDEYDEVYAVDPGAENVVEYEKEGWSLEVPELVSWPKTADVDDSDADPADGELVPADERARFPSVAWGPILAGVVVTAVAYNLAEFAFQSSTIAYVVGGLALLALVAKPDAGHGYVDLAPAHYNQVIANMVTHVDDWTEEADREYFQQKYYEEMASHRAESVREVERRERSTFDRLADELGPESNTPSRRKNGRTGGEEAYSGDD